MVKTKSCPSGSALGKIGTVRHEETIVKELAEDEDPEAREAAAFAFGNCRHRRLKAKNFENIKSSL